MPDQHEPTFNPAITTLSPTPPTSDPASPSGFQVFQSPSAKLVQVPKTEVDEARHRE